MSDNEVEKDAETIKETLAALRWKEDMAVVNDFGEHVWLGPCFDKDGKRIGITDCCRVDAPCQRHGRRLAERAKEEFSAHAVRAATERNEALRAKEAAEARVEALRGALENCRLMAARMTRRMNDTPYREKWEAVLRFCHEVGIRGSVLREAALAGDGNPEGMTITYKADASTSAAWRAMEARVEALEAQIDEIVRVAVAEDAGTSELIDACAALAEWWSAQKTALVEAATTLPVEDDDD